MYYKKIQGIPITLDQYNIIKEAGFGYFLHCFDGCSTMEYYLGYIIDECRLTHISSESFGVNTNATNIDLYIDYIMSLIGLQANDAWYFNMATYHGFVKEGEFEF